MEGKRALRSSRILNECNLSSIACVADALNLRYIRMDHTNGLDKCVGRLEHRLVLYYYSVKKLQNIEEKSLRNVAIVANFLDDNKPKRYLKSGFALFQT